MRKQNGTEGEIKCGTKTEEMQAVGNRIDIESCPPPKGGGNLASINFAKDYGYNEIYTN